MNDKRDQEGRSGVERAAILLLTLGEQEAAQVLKHMGAREVQKVGAAMTRLTGVSRDEVSGVLTDFSSTRGEPDVGRRRRRRLPAQGARRCARPGQGRERHRPHQPRPDQQGPRGPEVDGPARGLRAASATNIRRSSRSCSPTSTPIRRPRSSRSCPPASGRTCSCASRRSTACSRARSPSSTTSWKSSSPASPRARPARLGGAKAAADIVNFLDPSVEGAVMEQIQRADEALGGKIQDLIFVFDNLLDIDDRGMQELLRNVQSDRLLIAMKGADDELKQKIFKNMSQRAAEMLKDDLEAKGPVKLSEVEGAQKEILTAARKLAEVRHDLAGRQGRRPVCLMRRTSGATPPPPAHAVRPARPSTVRSSAVASPRKRKPRSKGAVREGLRTTASRPRVARSMRSSCSFVPRRSGSIPSELAREAVRRASTRMWNSSSPCSRSPSASRWSGAS